MKKLLFLLFFSFLYAYKFIGIGGLYSNNATQGGGFDFYIGQKVEVNRLYINIGFYSYDNNSSISDYSLNYDRFFDNFYVGLGAHQIGIDDLNGDVFGFSLRMGYLQLLNDNWNIDFNIEKIYVNNYHNLFNLFFGVEYKFGDDKWIPDFPFPY